MSHFSKVSSKVSWSIIAVTLVFGGVQFGMASDNGLMRDNSEPEYVGANTSFTVNRAAKTDREAAVPAQAQTVTLAFQLRDLGSTSVAMRLPASGFSSANSGQNSAAKPTVVGKRKMAVACEPVVSVLTDVAKQLEPGRCVT
jgi:hypothetical protein